MAARLIIMLACLILTASTCFATTSHTILDITGSADVVEFEGDVFINSGGLFLTGPTDYASLPAGPFFAGQSYTVTDSVLWPVGTPGGAGCLGSLCGYSRGDFTWQYSFVMPTLLGGGIIDAPATVWGSFQVHAQDFTPLFAGTIMATGTATPLFSTNSLDGEGPYLLNNDFVEYSGTADVQIFTPEPPTVFLFLGGLPLVWCFYTRERVLSKSRI